MSFQFALNIPVKKLLLRPYLNRGSLSNNCILISSYVIQFLLAPIKICFSLASTYYRNAQGVLILFDLTNPNSFFTAQQWVAELLSMNRRYLILLIGNKLDLSFRSVSNETALSYAKNVGIGYIEVSAKTAQNIDNILVEIISSAKDMNFLASLRSPSILRLEETTEIIKKKKFCLFC